MYRLIINSFLLFFGALGATNALSEQMYSQFTRSAPEFDIAVVASLGERLVSTETGEFRDCLVPSFDHYKNFLGAVYSIKAHVPICRRSSSDNLFRPPYFSYVYGASVEDMPVVFEQKKNRYQLCIKKWGVTGTCVKNLDKESVKTGPHFIPTGGKVQKAIEFKGYSDGIVKLSYVEASGEWSNEMVRRDFEWDARTGQVFSYGDYNLLIEQASPNSVTYRRVREAQRLEGERFTTRGNDTEPDHTKVNEAVDELIPVASGSGFFVSQEGHFVTNNHVIESCAAVTVAQAGRELETVLLATDKVNDLALLKTEYQPKDVISIGDSKPQLLQEIYVAGFPFGKAVSSSVKVTKGIVSSLTGLADNYSNIQIDAALQPGNSGGPILDSMGNGIGVSVSKLDLQLFVEAYGVVPENTNFGIRGDVVGNLLEANGVPLVPPSQTAMQSSDLGKKIIDSTIYLSCLAKRSQIPSLKAKKVLFSELQR